MYTPHSFSHKKKKKMQPLPQTLVQLKELCEREVVHTFSYKELRDICDNLGLGRPTKSIDRIWKRRYIKFLYQKVELPLPLNLERAYARPTKRQRATAEMMRDSYAAAAAADDDDDDAAAAAPPPPPAAMFDASSVEENDGRDGSLSFFLLSDDEDDIIEVEDDVDVDVPPSAERRTHMQKRNRVRAQFHNGVCDMKRLCMAISTKPLSQQFRYYGRFLHLAEKQSKRIRLINEHNTMWTEWRVKTELQSRLNEYSNRRKKRN